MGIWADEFLFPPEDENRCSDLADREDRQSRPSGKSDSVSRIHRDTPQTTAIVDYLMIAVVRARATLNNQPVPALLPAGP